MVCKCEPPSSQTPLSYTSQQWLVSSFEMEKMEINTPSTRSKSRATPSLYEKIIRNNNSNNLNQKSDKKKNTRVSFEDVIKIEMNDTPGVEGQLYFQYIYSSFIRNYQHFENCGDL